MRRPTPFFLAICLCLSASVDLQAQASPGPHRSVQHADITLHPHGLTIEIVLSTAFLPQAVPLTNPDRLVFDFPGFALPAGNRQMPVHNGPVRRFRAALFQSDPPITRIVIDLKEAVTFDVKSVGNKVVIEIPFSKANSIPADSTPPPPSGKKNLETINEKNLETINEAEAPAGKAETKSAPPTAAPTPPSGATAYKLQDKAKALKLEALQNLEDKASAGDPEAETLLALALHSGTLLKRDDAEALRLLRKAADQGSMAAQESLGIFSAMGIGMQHPDPTEAMEWYKKAAQQGSLDAATNIALMYADGIGIQKDPSQAMIWFRKAAEAGDATAQYNLA